MSKLRSLIVTMPRSAWRFNAHNRHKPLAIIDTVLLEVATSDEYDLILLEDALLSTNTGHVRNSSQISWYFKYCMYLSIAPIHPSSHAHCGDQAAAIPEIRKKSLLRIRQEAI